MFSSLGWGEMLVIATVAILVVGPKELPGMLRTVGKTFRQLKNMAGDFQKQFSEALDETDMADLKDLKNMNPLNEIKDSLNPLKQDMDDMKDDFDLTWMDDDEPQKNAQKALDKRAALEAYTTTTSAEPNATPTTTETKKPAAKKPAIKKAPAKKPAVKKAATTKASSSKSAAKTSAAQKPATKKPAAKSAASKKSATSPKTSKANVKADKA